MVVITGASGLIGQAESGLVCKTFYSEFESGKIQFLVLDSASACEQDGKKRLFIKNTSYCSDKSCHGTRLIQARAFSAFNFSFGCKYSR